MDEKTMVNDILNEIKLELVNYENIIAQTENLGLRQILIQIRNNDESFQYELYKIAKMKEYYKQSNYATNSEVKKVRKDIIENNKREKKREKSQK